MKTKSELKRIAVQNPDALLKEYEALRMENENLNRKLISKNEVRGILEEELGKLRAENEKLRAQTQIALGVGDGTGKLFVYGDYDSIKTVQAMIFENEKLRETLKQVKQLREADEDEIKKLENELGKVRAENEQLWDGTVLGRLKAENERLKGEVLDERYRHNPVLELRAQLAEAEGVLKFYATGEHVIAYDFKDLVESDIKGTRHHGNDFTLDCGEKARAYLEKTKARGGKMTTPLTLARELLEKAEKATPGPWHADIGNWQIESHAENAYRDGICTFDFSSRDGLTGETNKIDPISDADFIAAANPENIKALCNALVTAVEALEYCTRFFKNPMRQNFACPNCDGGASGFSTNGPQYHDDKEPHICSELRAHTALVEIRGD